MSFFEELKRRNVFKVGIAYLAGGWLLLQFLDILLPTFNAPSWVMQVIVLVISVGFFISLFIAWAFELTPQGIKPTAEVHPEESITPQTAQKLNRLTIITLALVLVLVVIDAYILTEPLPQAEESAVAQAEVDEPVTVIADKSIAVLPFVNQSNDPDQEYFANGLAEELLNRLARVQDLLVAGRTSSFYFKDRNESMAEIGRQLGVAHILEGSVRKAGSQVRVSAQLLRADNGFQLWSATYDRNLEDIFMIQDEISEAVTTALSVTLGAGEFDRPGMTTNVQAYEAFLRSDKSEIGLPERNLEAIQYLQNAVAIDPDFGLAWDALYRKYQFIMLALPSEQAAEFASLAANALEQSGELMPESPEYLISNAVFLRRMGQWRQAEELFLMAINNYGNSDAQANLNYGELLWSVGRINDALLHLQRARRLDPKQVDISVRLAVTLVSLEQYDAAEEEIARGLEADPRNEFANVVFSGIKDFRAGNYNETIRITDRASPDSPVSVWNNVMRKMNEADTDTALELMRDYAASQSVSAVMRTALGAVAADAGDYTLALSFFAKEPDDIDTFGSLPMWQPRLSGMRQDEGFKDLAADAGLVNYWRTTGNWADKCQPIEGTDDFSCI